MLFSLSASTVHSVPAPKLTVDVLIQRKIDDAVREGRFASAAQVLKAVGKSSGYLAELRQRVAKNPSATIALETARKFADVLGCAVSDLVPGDAADETEQPWEKLAREQGHDPTDPVVAEVFQTAFQGALGMIVQFADAELSRRRGEAKGKATTKTRKADGGDY